MRGQSSRSMITLAIGVAAACGVLSLSIARTSAQVPSVAATASASNTAPAAPLKTAWGEPDLQGIWTDESDTPLQRSPKFANQEYFTEAQRAELDKERAALLGRDRRVERGTELDVAGAYNAQFMSVKHTGTRTSLIVDPPNGRIPPLTPEAQKIAASDRQFRLALLQSTTTCKDKSVGCAGGKYDPVPSPRFDELPPRYNTARMNRRNGPEDGALPDRCLTGGLPEFGGATGSFRRIIQTPGGITMFYDVGQGQGWQRNIVMNGSPHLPSTIRQWYGDSRGHWEGNTLVIDVTNFSPKTDFQGSRENLHLIERWTRTGPNSLEYVVTIEDPTVWTRPWTVKQEFTRQSDTENRIYYEPRCIEGNYASPGLMRGQRMAEEAFAKGQGPDPRTADNATDFVGVEDDPLQ
ncbi:MAG TPA: hypothetical protein VFB23_11850 [Candidatus Acidoferrales bacterium]|nr:hypothetical protein [Candidatus Acidoferrales bacterium]